MPSAPPHRDASSSAAPAGTSALLARWLASVRQSSGSADPLTPADPCVVGLPRGLSERLPVVLVRALATVSSCTVALRSELPLAPSGAGAIATAADPDSPNLVPRSWENHP